MVSSSVQRNSMPGQSLKKGRTHIDGLAEMMHTVCPSARAFFMIGFASGRMIWLYALAKSVAFSFSSCSLMPPNICLKRRSLRVWLE